MPFIWMILDVLFESFGLKRYLSYGGWSLNRGSPHGMAPRSLKRRQLEILHMGFERLSQSVSIP